MRATRSVRFLVTISGSTIATSPLLRSVTITTRGMARLEGASSSYRTVSQLSD